MFLTWCIVIKECRYFPGDISWFIHHVLIKHLSCDKQQSQALGSPRWIGRPWLFATWSSKSRAAVDKGNKSQVINNVSINCDRYWEGNRKCAEKLIGELGLPQAESLEEGFSEIVTCPLSSEAQGGTKDPFCSWDLSTDRAVRNLGIPEEPGRCVGVLASKLSPCLGGWAFVNVY